MTNKFDKSKLARRSTALLAAVGTLGLSTVGAHAQTSRSSTSISDSVSAPAAPSSKRAQRRDWRQLAPGVTVGGSLRVRTEVKSDAKFGAAVPGNDEQYSLTQFRVNLKWTPAEWVTIFVEAQDARIFGEEAINEDAVPNIFADDADLHQGYIQLHLSLDIAPATVTVGRQKLNMGAQRLISSLEWVNTARVWDAVRLDVGKTNQRTLTAFFSRLVPVDPSVFNYHTITGSRMFNSYFHGIYYTDWQVVQNAQLEGYWLMRHDGQTGDNVHTLGGRLKGRRSAWDGELEAAAQFGTFGTDDHRAAMVHVGVGYTAASLNASRFGIAYNYGSGDDDPSDGKHTTFDNQYPLNHAYYGYMDLFSLQNIHNLEATFNTKVQGKLALRIAHQAFWLSKQNGDAWYNAGVGVVRQAQGQSVRSFVGNEVDITVKYPLWNGRLVLESGYSRFFTGGYVSDTGTSDGAGFFYLMTKITM